LALATVALKLETKTESFKNRLGEKKKAGHYSGHFTINTPTGYPIPDFPKVTITGYTPSPMPIAQALPVAHSRNRRLKVPVGRNGCIKLIASTPLGICKKLAIFADYVPRAHDKFNSDGKIVLVMRTMFLSSPTPPG